MRTPGLKVLINPNHVEEGTYFLCACDIIANHRSQVVPQFGHVVAMEFWFLLAYLAIGR